MIVRRFLDAVSQGVGICGVIAELKAAAVCCRTVNSRRISYRMSHGSRPALASLAWPQCSQREPNSTKVLAPPQLTAMLG